MIACVRTVPESRAMKEAAAGSRTALSAQRRRRAANPSGTADAASCATRRVHSARTGRRRKGRAQEPLPSTCSSSLAAAAGPSWGTSRTTRRRLRPAQLPASAMARREKANDASGGCCGSRCHLACAPSGCAEACGSASAMSVCFFRGRDASDRSFPPRRSLCSTRKQRNAKQEPQAARRWLTASRRAVVPRGFSCADQRAKCASEESRDLETDADTACRSFASNLPT